MYFLTYLRRELRRRMRQAVFIAIGLAVGIGLVITVIGASNGVKGAQAKVLKALYGIGTDLTVTTQPQRPNPSTGGGAPGQTFQIGGGPGQAPSGQSCINGKCTPLKGGDVIDTLSDPDYGPMSASETARIAALAHVKQATSGLLLRDDRIVIPTSQNGPLPQPVSANVDGVDLTRPVQGPLSNAALVKGRSLTRNDQKSDQYGALVDMNYATSRNLRVGGTITLAGKAFRIVGLVSQPRASTPPDVYIPLSTAQQLAIDPATGKNLRNAVDTIYVTADSAADIAAVQDEIRHLLPNATVTSSSTLASQVTGSLASTAKLANELGRWLAVVVLIAAFAVASLLTLAAVSRRIPEFGTLKALGWRGGRIVGQVLGESVITGIAGGLVGIGLGAAGVAIIDKVAPKLTATLPSQGGAGAGLQTQFAGPGSGPVGPGNGTFNPAASAHATVSVPMSASVTVGAILLAVLLAVAGGLLAGSFGGWRAARLSPAAALRKVA